MVEKNYVEEVELPWIKEEEKVRLLEVDASTQKSLENAIDMCADNDKSRNRLSPIVRMLKRENPEPYSVHQALYHYAPWWFTLRLLWKTQKFLDAYLLGDEGKIEEVYLMEDIEELVTVDDKFGHSRSNFFVGTNFPDKYHNEGLVNHYGRIFVPEFRSALCISNLGEHNFIDTLLEQGASAYLNAREVVIEILKDVDTSADVDQEFVKVWMEHEIARPEKMIELLRSYERNLCLTYGLIDGIFSRDRFGEIGKQDIYWAAPDGWPRCPRSMYTGDLIDSLEDSLREKEWAEGILNRAKQLTE